jgi:hypothetical protein
MVTARTRPLTGRKWCPEDSATMCEEFNSSIVELYQALNVILFIFE